MVFFPFFPLEDINLAIDHPVYTLDCKFNEYWIEAWNGQFVLGLYNHILNSDIRPEDPRTFLSQCTGDEQKHCSQLFYFRAQSLSHLHFLAGKMHLVEETDDLASNVLAASLLVVHDTSRGGKDDVAELTGREELGNPLLDISEAHVVAGGDAA